MNFEVEVGSLIVSVYDLENKGIAILWVLRRAFTTVTFESSPFCERKIPRSKA